MRRGIDAFLFSAEKDEDPWTVSVINPSLVPCADTLSAIDQFTLESEPRRRPGPRTQLRVPLPGNARYSQPSHHSGTAVLSSNRIVSAPAILEETRMEAERASASTSTQNNKLKTPGTKVSPSIYVQQASASSRTSTSFVDPHSSLSSPFQTMPEWTFPYSSGGHEPSGSYGVHSHAIPLPPPSAQQQMVNPYAWPTFPHQTPYYLQQNPYHHSVNAQQAMYVQQPAYPQPTSYEDSSIVSYGCPDVDSSSYYTGDEETDDEQQQGGFFFPAIPTPATLSRRTSGASHTTAVPLPPTASRRSSIVPLPHLPPLAALVAERRNSAAPAGARKSSLAPAVTVRRSSVAPQTRLVRDSPLKESKSTQFSPPPSPPPGATLVPHHRRPGSLTSTSTSKTMQKHQSGPRNVNSDGGQQKGWHTSRPLSAPDTATSWRSRTPATQQAESTGPSQSQPREPSTRGRGGARGRGRGRGKKREAASNAAPLPTGAE